MKHAIGTRKESLGCPNISESFFDQITSRLLTVLALDLGVAVDGGAYASCKGSAIQTLDPARLS